MIVKHCQLKGRGKCGKIARVWVVRTIYAFGSDHPHESVDAGCLDCAASNRSVTDTQPLDQPILHVEGAVVA